MKVFLYEFFFYIYTLSRIYKSKKKKISKFVNERVNNNVSDIKVRALSGYFVANNITAAAVADNYNDDDEDVI